MYLKGFAAPVVMGVINMSPNSFMNPHKNVDSALRSVEAMVSAGAQFIDVGGEATSPLVNMTKEKPEILEEIDRVLPLVKAIKERFDVLVSVDTSELEVMKAVISAGADMINNQQANKHPECLELIAKANVIFCLMHFFSPPRKPGSSNLSELLITVKSELEVWLARALKAGISRDKIILDPGFGGGNYGKNTPENFYLLAHVDEFSKMGYPLLLGWSRKSMIGEVLGNVVPEERLFGSLAAETILALKGTAIIRTHDVKPVCDMIKIVNYYQGFKS
jgi:dihydropteroate synthase